MTAEQLDQATLKEGDVVHVRAVVCHRVHGMDACWTLAVGSGVATVRRSRIVHVEPRPAKVGDEVRIGVGAVIWHVIAIDGVDAWLRDGSGARRTSPLSDLRRA